MHSLIVPCVQKSIWYFANGYDNLEKYWAKLRLSASILYQELIFVCTDLLLLLFKLPVHQNYIEKWKDYDLEKANYISFNELNSCTSDTLINTSQADFCLKSNIKEVLTKEVLTTLWNLIIYHYKCVFSKFIQILTYFCLFVLIFWQRWPNMKRFLNTELWQVVTFGIKRI